MNPALSTSPSFIKSKGEVASLIGQADWTHAPLGRMECWPQQLLFSLDLILDASFPMFLLWGPELTCFYNDALRPVFEKGGRHPLALGQSARVIWKEEWSAMEPLINGVLEGEETGLLEDQGLPGFSNEQGAASFWTCSFSTLKNKDGRVQGVLAICYDTTRKVQQRAASENLHVQLSQTLEGCGLGTWELNPATMEFTCNHKTREIFGLTGFGAIDLAAALAGIAPEDRVRIHRAITLALGGEAGGRYLQEYAVLHPVSGARQVVRAQGQVFFDEQGRAEKFTGTIQDITTEKHAVNSREKLLQLLEHSNDFMAMATLEGTMTYLNPAGRQLVGLSADADLSALTIRDFYSAEQFRFITREVIPALYRDERWSGVVHIKHQETGVAIPCFGNYMLIRDPATGELISRGVTLRDLRGELKANRELADSEMRFQSLVQEAPVATAIYLGGEMKIQWANDAMVGLWGKDQKVTGKTIREALPELEGQPFHQLLEQVYTTGTIYQATEDRCMLEVAGKLQTFYFNFSYKPLRDANGNIYGIVNMAVDVTEMVRSKRRLQESENAFRNLIMKAPVGICLLSGNTFIVDIANEQYLNLVGKSPEELLHRPIWEVLPEAKAQGFDVLLDGVKKSGNTYHGNEQPVVLIRNGQEETLYLNFVYEPLFDEHHQVQNILVIAIDITQQVVLRQQITDAEERARIAVASANLGTYEVQIDTGKVIGSPRFKELFDFEENAGHADYVARIHPDDLTLRQLAHQSALVSGLLHYECRISRRSGTECWLQIHGQVYFDQHRRPLKIIGIVQDVTDRKRSEQELEVRVRERTAALVQLNEELQQFIYISSHDLKEPLRKMLVFSSLAKEQAGTGNEKLQVSLDKVVHSAGRMTTLLSDLNQYAELSNVHKAIEKVDLNEVLHIVLGDLELVIAEKEATVLADKLPVIEGDRFQLTRLLYNLVHNGLKFSKAGRMPKLYISSSLVGQEEKRVQGLPPAEPFYQLLFEDNGIGFNQEYAEKVFVVFQRLHDRSEYMGNGMGLAICKKVVANHNGRITASAQEGQGATFCVLLPASPFEAMAR